MTRCRTYRSVSLPHITLAKRHIVDLCRCPAQIRSASPPYCFWIQKNQWLYRGMLDTRILPSFEHVLKHADRHVHDAKLCRGLVESSSLTQASTKYSLPSACTHAMTKCCWSREGRRSATLWCLLHSGKGHVRSATLQIVEERVTDVCAEFVPGLLPPTPTNSWRTQLH
jgi:hypothetical protein